MMNQAPLPCRALLGALPLIICFSLANAKLVDPNPMTEAQLRYHLLRAPAIVECTLLSCENAEIYHKGRGVTEGCGLLTIRVERVLKGLPRPGQLLRICFPASCDAAPGPSKPPGSLRLVMGERYFVTLRYLPWSSPHELWAFRSLSGRIEDTELDLGRVRDDNAENDREAIESVLASVDLENLAASSDVILRAEVTELEIRGPRRLPPAQFGEVGAVASEVYKGADVLDASLRFQLSAQGNSADWRVALRPRMEIGDDVIVCLESRGGVLNLIESAGVYSTWFVVGDSAEVRYQPSSDYEPVVLERLALSDLRERIALQSD